ncbi:MULTISPECIES: hypothetical protein [Phocaeicola]|uniref:hypothetical protein n=1 Tax=Phocaeicola TaxID=909656 RepID=UPI002012ADF3|nr:MULTISPECIES: hypothetical protein [Phocaeicola]MCL1613713.1 hypothetical protein [Phocaeicola plebeius]MDM8308776.1 hypothetical protein [Phocaeicola barnesiae]
MKNFTYYLVMALLALLPLSLTSCNNDDDLENGSSDYIELTFNGKTYKESIPAFGYVYLDDTETDSEGRRITLTNVSIDAFDKYGFSFMPSIGHFAKKSDLMSAKPGEYLHKSAFGNIWEGEFNVENFTLVTDLEIFDDDTYYELMNGKHYVNSIKEIGNEEVQIEGTFNGTYYCSDNDKECEIQGKYRMTLNVHNSNNPLD